MATGFSRTWLIVIGAVILALSSAFTHAVSANDESRFASVESLIDRGTWAIDDSIFVKVPQEGEKTYIAADDQEKGTKDKLYIAGHFYSDKPPVLSLYLAPVYWVLKTLSGLSAAANPHLFIYAMTVASAGLAYVLSVFCVWRLSERAGLSENLSFLLTLSFAAATAAPIYARATNAHIVQMAILAFLLLAMTSDRRRSALIGLLAGLAYTLDLGVGPVIIIATLVFVVAKFRSWTSLVVCALAMIPFMALHHAINYWISGMIGPANANPQFFDHPGSMFSPGSLTGGFHHKSLLSFVIYSIRIMFDPRLGFVFQNLPLLLIPVSATAVWRSFPDRRPELVFSALLFLGAWAVYAIGSTDFGGYDFGVRWFMPLLIPAWYVLSLTLKCRPDLVLPFALLALCGFVLVVVSFAEGPLALAPRMISLAGALRAIPQMAALAIAVASAFRVRGTNRPAGFSDPALRAPGS